MLRDWQATNQAGLSPHEMHCHQYLGMDLFDLVPKLQLGDALVYEAFLRRRMVFRTWTFANTRQV